MNLVKKEEEPTSIGFSATRLGMDRTIEKQAASSVSPAATDRSANKR